MKMVIHIASAMQDPVIARVILGTGVEINVDRANIDATSGEIVLEIRARGRIRLSARASDTQGRG